MNCSLRLTLTLIILLTTFLSPQLYSQVRADSTTLSDSTHVVIPDTTVKPIIPIPLVGSIDRSLPANAIITDSTKNFIDYTYLGDLLSMTPGLFTLQLGSTGQMHGLTLNGLDAHNIAFMSDGISLNDPYTGLFDLNFYPTEHIERIEVIQGTRAFVYGLNSTGGAINIVTKSKKAIHPYSRIRYSESGYGYGVIDGMFSQDIIRGMNVTAGTQHTTLGGRFPNSDYDAWNGRIKLRYNINDNLDVFVSEMYNQTQLGLNGGIVLSTPQPLLFDRLRATVANSDAYEKVTRNDVQAGIAAKLFPDSSAITTLTFYYSNSLREYRDEENRPNPNGIFLQEDYHSLWYGAKFTQHVPLGKSGVDIGTEVQTRGVQATATLGRYFRTLGSVYAIGELKVLRPVSFSPYFRLDKYLNDDRLSAGVDLNAEIVKGVTVFGGISHSYSYPTLQEISGPLDTLGGTINHFSSDEHTIFEMGISLGEYGTEFFSGKYFHREVSYLFSYPFGELLYYKNTTSYEGFIVQAQLRLGSFVLEGQSEYLKITTSSNGEQFLPRWSASGGIFYWDKLAKNHLDLKIGIRGQTFSGYHASTFDQRFQLFVPQLSGDIDPSNTIDFTLIAHLGSAYIHFTWENLLDRQYITTLFYPITDRIIRFGVSWEFSE
jgi:outer membrane cobalamin receptor